MVQIIKTFRVIAQRTLRRLRNTPNYFLLLWRWVTWLLALITIVSIHGNPKPSLAVLLLTLTLLQTLLVTLYTPVFQILLPSLPGNKRIRPSKGAKQSKVWSRRQPLGADEEADILTPLARSRNPYWDIAIYGMDVVICGMVTYYGGYFGTPHFGIGSPFYRYGLSTALAAALTYRYRGGLAAAFGYDLLILFGAFFPPTQIPYDALNARDLAGSLIDAPVIAILAAYIASLLESYTRSKRREQDNVRNQRALLHVGETLVAGASDRQHLLQQSAEQIRRGGHFERLIIALLRDLDEAEDSEGLRLRIDTSVEAGFVESTIPDKSKLLLEQVAQAGEKTNTFEQLNEEEAYGIARLYLPLFKEKQVSMVVGAESTRQKPFEKKQEEFLRTVGTQLVVALENIRLTEQTAELAAAAERGRIAREIHDGVAQLVYMLSLNTETCAALAHRIAEASEDDDEVLAPLAERLDKLVMISKQALWETRHYMFTLKPLMRGTSTLTQMLTNQLREFETISGLPVQFEVEGSEETDDGNQHDTRRTAQVGTAVFRITQEALTNAYKHAGATQLQVHLRHLPRCIEVEICDNGKGLDTTEHRDDPAANSVGQRIYSGHGMGGMRERAEELGGSFEIRQPADGGVSVLVRLPV